MKLKRRLYCKSYREFRKIERKYSGYFFNLKYRKSHYEHLNRLWYVWIEYEFRTLEELEKFYKYVSRPFHKRKRNYLTKYRKTLSKIVKKVIDNYGKECKYGTLRGFSITNEDYYYVYQNKDGKLIYDTSCSKIE